jgi:glycosyltransferase involved in cell wall biosynthesis
MRLLLVNHYAGGPTLGMEFRPWHLAREWGRAGHEVLVLAASFSHVRSAQPPRERVGGDVGRGRELDGVPMHFFATPAYRGNGVPRALNIAAFLAQVAWHAHRLAERFRPDAVIASSTYPMDVWPVRRIARRAGGVWVHEVHDLWPLSPIELSGMSPRHPFARVCQLAEDTACREADLVVSMLPKVHAHLAAHGLGDPRRLAIVPNGIDPEAATAAPTPLRDDVREALAAARARGAVVVGYAGSMGTPNALHTLLDAVRGLAAEGAPPPGVPPLSFVLVGDGHEREGLVERVRREGLAPHVCFLPPVPKAMVPAFLAAIDIAHIGWQRVPIYRFGIAPNKLMDYMLAGCAVLHAVEAGNDPVAESGCGLTVAPASPTALVQGWRALAARTRAERRAMGERGRAFVLAHHAWPVLAARFVEAVKRAQALPPRTASGRGRHG